MTILTRLIARLKELHERATPGPWTRSSVYHYDQTLTYIECESDESIVIETASGIKPKNSKLICDLRNALPLLLEVIETQREALEKCHEELVGYLWHQGGDLQRALEIADQALARCEKVVQEEMK